MLTVPTPEICAMLALRPAIARSYHRHGTTTVEFALTAPILFLLVFASIEFSRANMLMQTTTIAAIEGARESIVPGATADDCRNRALSELSALGISSATVTVNPSTLTADTTQVTVRVNVPLDGANAYLLPKFLVGKSVTKEVTLQREGRYDAVGNEPQPTPPSNNGGNNENNGNHNGADNGEGNGYGHGI
jgi:Flp pilus assembly protein TadG